MRKALFALLLLGLAGPASAFTFTNLGIQAGDPPTDLWAVVVQASDQGDSFDIQWSVGSPILSAEATFVITSFSNTSIVLDVQIAHTTNLADSGLVNAAILSLGLGVDPNATAVLTVAGSVFDMVGVGSGPQQTFPGGFKQIDVCVFAQGCSGGSINEGLAAGASDSFQLTLSPVSGGSFADGATLAFFPIKFQTSAGSFEPAGAPPIPEPTSMLLYAVGLAIAFTWRNPRRR